METEREREGEGWWGKGDRERYELQQEMLSSYVIMYM